MGELIMNERNEKDYIVFSQKLAGYLMFNGCRLLKIKHDKETPTKFVYFFPNTEQVVGIVQKYKTLSK
jgi:hypothetical protein